MRGVDTWLDRFAARHPRLGVPRLMLYIVIGNLIVYFFDLFSAGSFSAMLAFLRPAILHGQLWRLVTFILVPMSENPFLLVLSLYFYYFIGDALEREWGPAKFTLYYLAGVLFSIAAGFATGFATMAYVNMSLFLAFATLWPDTQFLLFFLLLL